MSDLALPPPRNFRGPKRVLLDSDVLDICDRLKEVHRSLLLYAYEEPVCLGDKVWNFCVTERCEDGVERLVARYEELDARIIESVQRMLHIPFEERLREAERAEAKAEDERKQQELEELYERVGAPMLPLLERTGFIQRPVSYPKRGVVPT